MKLSSFMLLAAILLLTGCSNLHFNDSEAGLLDFGQILSRDRCSKFSNHSEYQTCINQINQNYDEAKRQLNPTNKKY